MLYLSLTLQREPTTIDLSEKVNFNTEKDNDYFHFTQERKETTKRSLFFIYYAKRGDLTKEISYNEDKKRNFLDIQMIKMADIFISLLWTTLRHM